MSKRALIALEIFVGIGAWYGSWMLSHGAWGLPASYLNRTPFDSWALPALALLLCVALPMTTAAIVELLNHSRAAEVSLAAGALLVGWIVVQVALIGLVFSLQPLMFVSGCVVCWLAWLERRNVARQATSSSRLVAYR